jgi:hypothetical protein
MLLGEVLERILPSILYSPDFRFAVRGVQLNRLQENSDERAEFSRPFGVYVVAQE